MLWSPRRSTRLTFSQPSNPDRDNLLTTRHRDHSTTDMATLRETHNSNHPGTKLVGSKESKDGIRTSSLPTRTRYTLRIPDIPNKTLWDPQDMLSCVRGNPLGDSKMTVTLGPHPELLSRNSRTTLPTSSCPETETLLIRSSKDLRTFNRDPTEATNLEETTMPTNLMLLKPMLTPNQLCWNDHLTVTILIS